MHKIPLLDEERILRRVPKLVTAGDEQLFLHEIDKTLPGTVLLKEENVKVWPGGSLTGNALPWPKDMSWAYPGSALRKPKGLVKNLLQKPKSWRRMKKGLWITDEFSNGYFHWLGDVLPKLEVLDALDPELLRSCPLVLPEMARFPYVLPSLQAFSIQEIIWSDRERGVRLDSLISVGSLAPTGNYRPDWMKKLGSRFRRAFGSPDVPSRRIWVSRSKAPKRRIANEDELLPVLKDYGFETVFLEDLDFKAQVKLISQAEVLMGLHGAGLTNMIFMAPGTKVVELRFEGDKENNCYFSLAGALDLEYHYLKVKPAGPNRDSHSADVIVGLNECKAALDLTGK